jgi:hypothetical protein
VHAREFPIDLLPRSHGIVANTAQLSRAEALRLGLNDWLVPLAPAAELADGVLVLQNTPTHDPFNTILLAHMRNELGHVFAAEALLAVAASVQSESSWSNFLFLNSLLDREFVLHCHSDADREALFARTTVALFKQHPERAGGAKRYILFCLFWFNFHLGLQNVWPSAKFARGWWRCFTACCGRFCGLTTQCSFFGSCPTTKTSCWCAK